MKVPFSPPDMTEQEAQEVREAILSGWIPLVHEQRNWNNRFRNMYTLRKRCA